MDIALDKTGGESLSLDFPATATKAERKLKLAAVKGISGALHTEPGLVQLIDARAESGEVAAMRWPVASGTIRLPQSGALAEVAVTADFPAKASGKKLSGTASAKEVLASVLELAFPALQLTTGIGLDDVEVKAGDGDLEASAGSARFENSQLLLGTLLIRGAVNAGGLRIQKSDGPLTVSAASASGLELSIVHKNAEVTAAGIELGKGFAYKAGELRIGELHVGAMRVLIPLDQDSSEAAEPAEAPALEATAPRSSVALVDDVVMLGERRLFDLRDLDRVGGNAEIAVFVRAQLPVVGSYKLDRTFKIPINNGSLDFVDVERQLGTIEDAFIDFAVRDNELIIKRDIPILPTKGKKLISWPLSNVEELLARARQVSLRTLSRFTLVKAKEGDSKASVAAVKIDVPALTLTLPPATANDDTSKDVSDAEFQVTAFEPLSMAGGLRFESDGGARELDASIRVAELGMKIESLPVGDSLLGASAIRVGELHFEVAEWDGFRPRALVLEFKDLEIEGLTLRAAPAAS